MGDAMENIKKEGLNIKANFLNDIECSEELNMYENSYKITLLIGLMAIADDNGKAPYGTVCNRIISLYNSRYINGLPVEKENSDIKFVNEVLNKVIVKKVMDDKAYTVFNNKGYIFKEDIEGTEHICFNEKLWKAFNYEEKNELKKFLYKILHVYYNEKIYL